MVFLFMAWFPLFFDLENKPVLILGGGHAALEKAQRLLPFHARITVCSPSFLEAFASLPVMQIEQEWSPDWFCPTDYLLIIAATDQPEINHAIALWAKEKNVLCNCVDDPDWCTVTFGAVVSGTEYAIGISTSGASPTAARYLKQKIREIVPEDFDSILLWLKQLRPYIRETVPSSLRPVVFRRLFEDAIRKGSALCAKEVERLIEHAEHRRNSMNRKPEISLVGAGCAGIEGITLAARHAIERADVIVYDRLIDPEILDLNPNAEKIERGKRGHEKSSSQQEIHELLLELSKRYAHIVRLQGGDPMVFGRGMEEIEILRQHNIDLQVLPGISSFYGIPAKDLFGLTRRNVAGGFMVLTGTSENTPRTKEEWKNIAEFSGTIVFLMAMNRLDEISHHLMEAGMDPHTPCAIFSSRSSMMTASASCTLDSLSACAKEHQLFSPAIVVISGTAALYDPPRHLRVGLCGSDALNQKLKDLLPASVQYQQLLKVRYHDLPLPDDLFDSGLPQWIVLTSAHGIHVLMREFQRLHIDHRKLANTRFALIGRQSARVLESYGIFADLVASPSSSQSLLETLKPELAEGDRVFLAQSRQAIDVLSRGLQEISSITVLEHPLYEVTFESSSLDFLPAKVKDDSPAWKELLQTDVLAVSSRECAKAVLRDHLLDRTKCIVAISKEVADVLENERSKSAIDLRIAETPDARGMAEAIETLLP